VRFGLPPHPGLSFRGEKVFRFPLPSEERRCSDSLSLQRREGVQIPSPFKGEKVFRLPLPSKERRYSGSLSLQRR